MMKRHAIASAVLASLSTVGLLGQALAQTSGSEQRIVITGSSIKRIATEGALPVQVISRQDLVRQGIASAEQLIMTLNINGNGMDNLASNADVVGNDQRGNNGATAANLRGQGSNATLVLLNGRRLAAHGLNGGTVDLNQIPFDAIERIEILKDGASAVYGTDAIGGVINFILRTNYQGGAVNLSADVTQRKGGEIYKGGVVAGFGDLNRDRYNILATFSVADYKALRGDQRDFVNLFQPDRGLSVDTRGTPIATIFPLASAANALSSGANGTGPADPQNPTGVRMSGGINYLDLPGQAGCASVDGMGPYDEVLWAAPASKYACGWDTGRAALLQQPVRNTNFVGRGTFRLGNHSIIAEAVLGRSESKKIFSNNQISSSAAANTTLRSATTATSISPAIPAAVVPNPFLSLGYPSTGADYTRVFNALVAYFPTLEANRGRPMFFRWRCTICGPREIETQTNTARFLLAAEGELPFASDWEYRTGISRATSDPKSVLGGGYFFQQGFANLINNGTINPFSLTQTQAARDAYAAVDARGTTLYSGKSTMDQVDFTASGPVAKLPAGTLMAAIGVDYRREGYAFKGDERYSPTATGAEILPFWIFNAPFDNALATAGTLKRDIKAVFGEVIVPVAKGLELNLAVRSDHYTGFGQTTNPKVTLRFAPSDMFLLRGAYSTAFRVPTFKQNFDPAYDSPYSASDFPDPATCPSGVVSTAVGCAAARPNVISGGNPNLKPETAKMYSLGLVIQPDPRFSANIDWWDIQRDGTIGIFPLTTMAANYALFADRFLRDSSGALTFVDTRVANAGETRTKGIEVGMRYNDNLLGGKVTAAFDLSYLLDKKSRLLTTAPMGPSEVGVFTRFGDLGVRWKHTASVGYSTGDWATLLSQVYRSGYRDYQLPGVANGSVQPPNWSPDVKAYSIFHLSVSYSGIKDLTITAGVKNLLDTDPPFSAAYDTATGAGSSWEPRVADPRGRSFLLGMSYKFF